MKAESTERTKTIKARHCNYKDPPAGPGKLNSRTLKSESAEREKTLRRMERQPVSDRAGLGKAS